MNEIQVIKKRNRQTAINLITSLVTLVITMAINFFLSPYIVKTLGEEANGFTQLANNFISYASLITIALNSMAGRFITIYYYKNDIDKCNRLYSSIIIANIFIMLVLILPATLCTVYLENLIRISDANIQQVKILFSIAFASFYASQIISLLNICTYVKNALYIQNIINMVSTIMRAVLLILMFTLFIPKIYYVSLAGFVLSILTIPVSYIVKRRIMSEIVFNVRLFDFKAIKVLLKSGIWNTINQCGTILMTGLDLLLSNLFIGPVQMGVLSVSKIVPNAITQLAVTINGAFSPNQTISYGADDKKELLDSLNYAVKVSCIMVSISIVVFSVYAYDFYVLWQPTLNAKELTILSILTCMMYIPFCGTQTLYNVFTAANKLAVNSISFLVTGILNFLIVYLLLEFTDLGLLAVAGTSSVLSMIRSAIITIPYTAKILGLKWYYFYKDSITSLICCGLVALISVGFRYLIMPKGWGMLILAIAVSVIMSIICSIFVILNKEQRKKLLVKMRIKHG